MKLSLCVSGFLLLLSPIAQACEVTKSGYASLKAGMSLAQAEGLLGCAGEEISSSEMGGFKTVMLQWQGKGTLGANMNAMFQNDKLINKAQFGLK